MKKKNYRMSVAIFTAVANLIYAGLIAHSVWHSYYVDKSKQDLLFKNEEQDRKQLKYDEELLQILNYNVLPMNALMAAFSAYVLWRLRKDDEPQSGISPKESNAPHPAPEGASESSPR